MSKAPPTFQPHGSQQKIRQCGQKDHDQRRGSSTARGYNYKWQQQRLVWFSSHPLCVCCLANGYTKPVKILDHIMPHKGDQILFWSRSNWQSLCNDCHERIKKPLEIRYSKGLIEADLLNLNRLVDSYEMGGAGQISGA